MLRSDHSGADFGTSGSAAHVTHIPVTDDGASHRITIPDTELLFSAKFTKAGSDLVLTGEDGHQIVLSGYFDSATRHDLVAPGGAVLSADLVAKLTLSQTPGQYAQTGAPTGGIVIGHVERLGGHATVQHANGSVEELKIGDNVLQGDVVETNGASQLGLSFNDGTAFNMGANARMVLSELVYDASSSSNSAVFSLVKGSISFVAGQVAKTGDMRVETPVATMGIRGTSVNTNISTDVNGNAVSVTYSLMADPDGHIGSFNILDRTTGAIIGTISTTDTTFVVTPSANLGVLAQQLDKTPDQIAQELAVAQALFPIFLANPTNFNSPNVTPQNTPTKSGSVGSSETFGGSQQNLTDPGSHNSDTGSHTGDPPPPTPPTNSAPVFHNTTDQNGTTTNVTLHTNSAPSIFADVPPDVVEARGVGFHSNPGVPTSLAHLFVQDIDGNSTVAYNTAALILAGWIADTAHAGVYTLAGTYGTAKLDTSANTLSYQLDNNNPATNALGSGDHPVDPFVIPVIDTSGATASTTVGFTVDGKNDTLNLAGGSVEFLSVAENTTAVTTVHTQDPHNSGMTYSIVSGLFSPDATKFTIDAVTGKLSFVNAPDYEHPTDPLHLNVYTVQVQVTDGTLTDTQTIFVHVTDVNDTAVAGNDTVITNNTSNSHYVIPGWALLANDTGPDGTPLNITGVTAGPGHDFASIDLSQGNVAIDDGHTVGGSFNYQLTSGSLIDLGHVTVTQDTNTMNGGNGNEIFIGDSNGTIINAGGGNDILIGNGGNDTLNGGSGNDTYGFGLSDGHDTINDTSGNDTIRIDTGGAALSGLSFAEGWSDDLVIKIDDTQITVANHYLGSNDIETVTFVGGANGGSYAGYDLGGTYNLSNDDGTNRTGSPTANSIIAGDGFHNNLTGGTGNDLLFGNGSYDTLNGGKGNDLLVGGTGADTFVFGPNFGKDTVVGFTVGFDKVDLDPTLLGNTAISDFLAAHVTEAAGSAVLTVGDNTITFHGVSATTLLAHPSDFHALTGV